LKPSIRLATVTDLPAMMALEKRAATAAHWSATQYETIFGSSGVRRIALIIHEQDETCLDGFVVARVIGEEWEIENIAIAGRARRRGLATTLLGQLLHLARTEGVAAVFLEVRESNRAARALYEKCSLLESSRRHRYYQDPEEDAILYRIDFK
jgi:ribosomal-protein-alanine N-acetyltransferase